ncbi:MAG: recombinase family protein [Lachnospiraceae bacterium]|jgi:DNA invertase Pin-like site-specific DNA recombinase|nr:recombinase family protein [Lachnospiraceae bacterium]MCH4027939.1 recombinase family protein [Lachnospiraceae bacterium]MCH4065783.1 recombinase family protein [Lachnospiraceae bacterium]MCH4111819.1 recombinase family protein [Lachnospiraceae bacterium]
MKKITEIKKSKPVLPERKKVAAYCRVSMETERLHHSLSAQVSRYSELIQSNPQWEFAGIYADEGISGTNAEKRPDFMRLIADCDAGKIDIVLTKSISRFARNTVDLLQTVRHLKDIGVEVRFEKENIRSLSDDGELMLTLLASFAQEESRSISENIKWGIRKRFEQGEPHSSPRTYGYAWKEKKLIVIPEEAEVVRRIYREYLSGKSKRSIYTDLNKDSIIAANGESWSATSISNVLRNVTYTGTMILQKTYSPDFKSHESRPNNGELTKYVIENDHEAIIDKETFEAVQEEQKRRSKAGIHGIPGINTCCFTSKLKCGICGTSYVHQLVKRKPPASPLAYWICGRKVHSDQTCPDSEWVPQRALENTCAEVLGTTEFDEDSFLQNVDWIEVQKNHTLVFHMMDGQLITRQWTSDAHQDYWTDENRAMWSERMRTRSCRMHFKDSSAFTTFIRCGLCGNNYRVHSFTCKDGTVRRIWGCPHNRNCRNSKMEEGTMKQLVCDVLDLPEFSEDAMNEAINYATINHWSITFHFRDGHEITRKYKHEKYRSNKS